MTNETPDEILAELDREDATVQQPTQPTPAQPTTGTTGTPAA